MSPPRQVALLPTVVSTSPVRRDTERSVAHSARPHRRHQRRLGRQAGSPARFLVLGSASPELMKQSSETLAGRIAFHDLGGLHSA